MMFKKINLLAGLGLTFLLSSFLASPVQAGAPLERKSESSEQINTHEQNHLISQVFGHDLYDGKPQIEWDGYMLGRVVRQTGEIIVVVLPDGTFFTSGIPEELRATSDWLSYPTPYNVLVEELDDGVYEIYIISHPRWISTLESEYGWRRVDRLPPLSERTAPIWAQLESR